MATNNPNVALVPIDIERDAPAGVQWLTGAAGRETLRLMGVTDAENHESDLEHERKRLREIIANPQEDAWMIKYGEEIVGIVEVDLADKPYILAPLLSIMLGDESVRGKGIGISVVNTTLDYLRTVGYSSVYARHLTHNAASAALLSRCGFVKDGEVYNDADQLAWQNMVRGLRET